jgi:hypothetical protein
MASCFLCSYYILIQAKYEGKVNQLQKDIVDQEARNRLLTREHRQVLSQMTQEKESSIACLRRCYSKAMASNELGHQGELRKINKLICDLEEKVSHLLLLVQYTPRGQCPNHL